MSPIIPSLQLTRRTLIISLGILLSILFLFIMIASFFPKEKPVIDDIKVTVDQAVNRVFIKDFYTYNNYLTPDRQRVVENVLYAYVSKNIPDLYTGTIRQNSFLQTKDTDGVLQTKLLIDISPANTTYILTITGTSKDDPKPIDIQCAPENQQKDPSVPCIDGVKQRE